MKRRCLIDLQKIDCMLDELMAFIENGELTKEPIKSVLTNLLDDENLFPQSEIEIRIYRFLTKLNKKNSPKFKIVAGD